MVVEYTLSAEDITSARLLAIGIRPRFEFGVFAVGVAALLAWSVSPWRFESMPLVIGLAAGLGGFRLMQIAKVREAAVAAFQRNPTLRRPTAASWNDHGITIQPAGSVAERVPWTPLLKLRENERVLVLLQPTGSMHAIPKRAFSDKQALAALRVSAAGTVSHHR